MSCEEGGETRQAKQAMQNIIISCGGNVFWLVTPTRVRATYKQQLPAHRHSNSTIDSTVMSGNLGLDSFVLDSITIEPAPQKKGLILRHVEYLVKSEQFRSEVTRRYSDFQALNDLLLYR